MTLSLSPDILFWINIARVDSRTKFLRGVCEKIDKR